MFAERKETQPRAQCQTRITSTKTAMPPAPPFRGAPSQNRRPFAHPVPKNAAGGRPLLVGLPPSARFTAPIGTKQSAQAPYSWGLGASTSSRRRWPAALPPPPARGAGVLFSVRHPGARGKEGAVPCDAALPRRGKGRCRCAGSTLFAPAGQKRFRVARLILGVSRERAVCGAVCPSGMAGRRAGKTEACRPMLHEAATFLPPSRGENGGLCPHPLKGSIP